MSQDHKDERFLCEMLAITISESLASEEDDTWQELLCFFSAEDLAVRVRIAFAELLRTEGQKRSDVVHEEFIDRNTLGVRCELLVHGFYDEAVQDHAPMLPPELVETKAESKIGPVLTHAVEPPLPSFDAMRCELTEDGNESVFLLNLKLEAVVKREAAKRTDIAQEQAHDYHRYEKNFAMGIRLFNEMEQQLVEEQDAWVMLNMSDNEKLIYRMNPVTNPEFYRRCCLVLEEAFDYRHLSMVLAEAVSFCHLMEMFRLGRKEIISEKRLLIYSIIESRTVKRHLALRMQPWRAMSHRSSKIKRCTMAVEYMAHKFQMNLVRRYCSRWNDRPENARMTCEQQGFMEEHNEQYLLLVVSEEEERDRNNLAMELHWASSQLAELFFQERDTIRKTCLQRDIIELFALNTRRLRMKRLVTWYNFWKARDLQRKCRWLLMQTEGCFAKDALHLWQKWYKHKVYVRRERHRLNTTVGPEKEVLCLFWIEDLWRNTILLEHSLEMSKWEVDHLQNMVMSKNRWRESVLASMAADCNLVQATYRFHTWRLWMAWKRKNAKAEKLMNRNLSLVMKRYFDKLANQFYERMAEYFGVVREHMNERRFIDMEEQEGRARTRLMMTEAYYRSRKDFRTTTVLGEKGHQNVLQSFASFASGVNKTLLELRWIKWTRFMKYQKHIRHCRLLSEHLDNEHEHRLMRMRYKCWKTYVQELQASRRKTAYLKRLLEQGAVIELEERNMRDLSAEEEQWAHARIVLSHQRVIVVLKRQQQKILCEIMAGLSDKSVMKMRYFKFIKFLQHRKFIAAQMSKVVAMEATNLNVVRYRYYRICMRFWWIKIRPKLAEDMAQKLGIKLLKRYFLKMAPAALRKARLSRARQHLDRAKAAAHILDKAGGIEIMKSKNPFSLPPLRVAAGKPPRAFDS